MADDKNTTHYFLDVNPEEAERLELSQEIISDHMQRAVWAPIDLSQPGLKILDSATASGESDGDALAGHACEAGAWDGGK
jgi:hypothetical protein